MRKMKDSGIEWIGEIPISWKLVPIKYLASYNDETLSENTDLEYEFDYIEIGSVEYGKGITQVEHLKFEDAPSRARRIVRPNDIIVSTVRTYLRAIATVEDSDRNQIASTGFVVIRAKEIDSEYLRYSILSESFISMVEANSIGISYPAINASVVVGFKIPVPREQEQKRIAKFLSEQCSALDNIVAKTRLSIEEYKKLKQTIIRQVVTKGLNSDVEMKESGIEWIGSMPITWSYIRGKYILKYMQKPIREDDAVITCFRDGEVTLRNNRREEGFTIANKEIGYQGVDKGDLVVHGMDGFAGAIGISDSRGKASPVLNVLETKQNKRYIMYYLRSMAYSDVFIAMSTGVRVRSCDLRWNKLAELPYPIPPLEEQQNIALFLDEKCSEIEKVISFKKEQIIMLEEYKKSLIFEYATGKKEIPETWE